jgi:hypothetical protein
MSSSTLRLLLYRTFGCRSMLKFLENRRYSVSLGKGFLKGFRVWKPV